MKLWEETVFIIPFIRCNLILIHCGKGINQMSAEVWINVTWKILGWFRPVLGPVGEIANKFVGRAW